MDEAFSIEIEKIFQEVDDDNKNYAIKAMLKLMVEMTFKKQFAEL